MQSKKIVIIHSHPIVTVDRTISILLLIHHTVIPMKVLSGINRLKDECPDLSTVTCYKCTMLGHYADKCPESHCQSDK